MSIIGHGIDIVDVARLRNLAERYTADLMGSYFTAVEIGIVGDGLGSIQSLAGRLAVKEAVIKALGIGLIDGVSFLDIEVQREPSGAPFVVLRGACKEVADRKGIIRWQVSISHTETVAMASAIALGETRRVWRSGAIRRLR